MNQVQVQGEFLPSDRVMKTQCEVDVKWINGDSTVLPHFLNQEKIVEKMRKNACLPPYEKTVEAKNGQSITIQCSTGGFYAVGVDLCYSWMAMSGQSSSSLHGMDLEVVSYKGDEDQGGAYQKYTVKLNVQGDDVTVSFHNTTNKVQVQGEQSGVRRFTETLLIPYFELNCKAKSLKISEINELLKISNRTRRKTAVQKSVRKEKVSKSNEESNNSMLVTSTLHPDWLQITPQSSPQRLVIEDQSADRLEAQMTLGLCSRRLEIEELSSDQMDAQNLEVTPGRLGADVPYANRLDDQGVFDENQPIDINQLQQLLTGNFRSEIEDRDEGQKEMAGDETAAIIPQLLTSSVAALKIPVVAEPRAAAWMDRQEELITTKSQVLPSYAWLGVINHTDGDCSSVIESDSDEPGGGTDDEDLPPKKNKRKAKYVKKTSNVANITDEEDIEDEPEDSVITTGKQEESCLSTGGEEITTPGPDNLEQPTGTDEEDIEYEPKDSVISNGKQKESCLSTGGEEITPGPANLEKPRLKEKMANMINVKEVDIANEVEVDKRLEDEPVSTFQLDAQKQPLPSGLWPLFYVKSSQSSTCSSNLLLSPSPSSYVPQKRPDITRMDEAPKPGPEVENSDLEESFSSSFGMETEVPKQNNLFSWKPPIPFNQIVTDLTSIPEPDNANLGDYLVYMCQSIQTLVHMTSRSNQFLNIHATSIESIQQRLNQVSDFQNDMTTAKSAYQLESEPQQALRSDPNSQPSYQDAPAEPDLSQHHLQPQQDDRLVNQAALEPASLFQPPPQSEQQQDKPESEDQPRGRNPTSNQSRRAPGQEYKCDECGFQVKSLKRLDGHISVSHSRPHHFQALAPATLLVGDSHQKILKRRWCVERALGRKGRLYTPGITYPSEERAYCSSKDWPGAWHPENSLEEVLPRLLMERPYSSAIVMAPCNDITNLGELSSPEEQRLMGSQSSRNTIRILEDALKSCPTLRKIVCVERPVRVDRLADLSSYSNSELKRMAASSEFSNRILVSSNMSELCSSEDEMVAVFRAPNSKGADGIHMRGDNGEQFFTEMLIAAAKMAGHSSTGLGGGRRAAPRLDGQQVPMMQRGPQPAQGVEDQRQKAQVATWAEVASNNSFSVLQLN